MNVLFRLVPVMVILLGSGPARGQETTDAGQPAVPAPEIRASVNMDLERVFDDKLLMEGYARKFAGASKETLLSMINDESLNVFKKAAAVRVFRGKFATQVAGRERALIERMMLRQLEMVKSPFVQVEIMHTLIILDRYHYFDAMIPVLIRKMDHYDPLVDDLSYKALDEVLNGGNSRTREARIVFNTLRKMFFLSRKKLKDAKPSDPRLRNRLQVLRWSIKALGTEELRNLPKEVIGLM